MEENQKKQIQNEIEISNNNSPIWEVSLFGASPKDIYIHHKIEKLCSAIHFVTNFFNDNEPLRLALRDRSVVLLSSSLSFIQSPNVSTLISQTSGKLIEIKSFLLTSRHTGLITEMNFNIINKEIEDLLKVIVSKKDGLFSLSASFMEVESIGQVENKIKDTNTTNNFLKDFVSERPIRTMSSTPNTVYSGKDKANDKERTKKIITLIKDKGDISIKDISSNIKGCSEKTLQRELLKLVLEGRIIKKGERRWSRYSII